MNITVMPQRDDEALPLGLAPVVCVRLCDTSRTHWKIALQSAVAIVARYGLTYVVHPRTRRTGASKARQHNERAAPAKIKN